MGSCCLFAKTPRIYFNPDTQHCDCTRPTTILKTTRKTIATLDVGQFDAVETHTTCKHCRRIYRSDQLRALTPERGKFGFDVIEFIGRELFLHCRNEADLKAELAIRNIPISTSEIGFLGKRFIVYLLLAHIQCQGELKQAMLSRGGYILHMDGTCAGDSPHLFSCIDELSRIVLGNSKMPTEDSQYIVPLLKSLKAAYGDPIAMVHDMGSAILKSVTQVFPEIPDFICHFHFLRDLGKDLFDIEYRAIRRITRSYNIRAKLKQSAKQFKAKINDDQSLSDSLKAYLKNNQETHCPEDQLNPSVTAYLLVAWMIESDSACHGFGFPFDHPHLEFYRRLQEAYPSLRLLKAEGVSGLPLISLSTVLRDSGLNKMVLRLESKISTFEALRKAMRIACPEHNRGLNDLGDDDIKTIKGRVDKFRYSGNVMALAKSDTGYHKMLKQIDKYWHQLFADPIPVETSVGRVMIQPQRTNNLMEQSFRFWKRDDRRKTGQHCLAKTLKAMLADTPLVRNLSNPDYMCEQRRKNASKLAF